MDRQAFYSGRLFDVYRCLGSHRAKEGFRFTTYAPNAKKIALVGDFNGWQEQWMYPDEGFFSLTVPSAECGNLYKYRIYADETDCTEHTDPYAFRMELRPGCCAVVAELGAYSFDDAEWMRERTVGYNRPVNIYELHMGSWKTNPASENGWYRYDELAELLIPYLLDNHYTHVEFLPLTEHPFDGSWGYQPTGFFAPTSRYGEPRHLMALIDKLHRAGIGAILDFVPVHFALDAYGLRNYDGTALYEYPHSDVAESEWGSCNFIYSRREVQCFMQSAAHFWLQEYHFDGLRMDAVSRMIYWQGDERRGVNPNSLHFLKQMNAELRRLHPTAMLIAEDSSAFPGVTKPVEAGGLGFDYKWSLGWMHDTLEYFQTAPEYRFRDYRKLTQTMTYFHTERFLLEFSHDENVHGKATILQKMNGSYEDKFPQGRALYLFMAVHPGKKLNFMGNEFGQLREWSEAAGQDWELLRYPAHDAFHRYMMELNRLYAACPALHDDDAEKNFQWADNTPNQDCMYAMVRTKGAQSLLAIFNLSDHPKTGYKVTVSGAQNARLLLHSDWEQYGGGTSTAALVWTQMEIKDAAVITADVPRFSGMLFVLDRCAE